MEDHRNSTSLAKCFNCNKTTTPNTPITCQCMHKWNSWSQYQQTTNI